MNESLDPQLWHDHAGGLVRMPRVDSLVYYFPQGHAENAQENVDFGGFPTIPPLFLCKVVSIVYLAESESVELYAKITLIPFEGSNDEFELLGFEENDENRKPDSFAKTLTQSDANNGGGFSVPKYCADTMFPPLDFSADPPVQTLFAKDVRGEIWKFRHIFRGTPRRHLLTTGWGNFVNQRRLMAGDSVVFYRAENGDLGIGSRRAISTGGGDNFPVFPNFMNENRVLEVRASPRRRGNVTAESVIEAVSLAVSGKQFEVVYYPRTSTAEFVVKASLVTAAMTVPWRPGMRLKMASETEDLRRISWLVGTVSSVQAADPNRWPDSPWRLLEVEWDEPIQGSKQISPWSAELIPDLPRTQTPALSPPSKRHRVVPISEPPPKVDVDGKQGARHVVETRDEKRRSTFLLFGQPIPTEKQTSETASEETRCNSLADEHQGHGPMKSSRCSSLDSKRDGTRRSRNG